MLRGIRGDGGEQKEEEREEPHGDTRRFAK